MTVTPESCTNKSIPVEKQMCDNSDVMKSFRMGSYSFLRMRFVNVYEYLLGDEATEVECRRTPQTANVEYILYFKPENSKSFAVHWGVGKAGKRNINTGEGFHEDNETDYTNPAPFHKIN